MLEKHLDPLIVDSDFMAIARRLFVMNGFDGALTLLGIVLGAFTAGITTHAYVIGSGLGACLAMGISGMTGAYLTESAERERELKHLEKVMLTDLSNSSQARAVRIIPILIAIVDGISPALMGCITLLPFLFGLNIELAYKLAIVLNMGTLFLLGIFLGRVSKKNLIVSGIKMLFIGLATALLLGVIVAF